MPTDSSTFLAACSNCAAWRAIDLDVGGHRTAIGARGVCTQGFAPPEGAVRCDHYVVSASFERAIVNRLMQDPMVLPVPLRGKAAKEARRRVRKGRL